MTRQSVVVFIKAYLEYVLISRVLLCLVRKPELEDLHESTCILQYAKSGLPVNLESTIEPLLSPNKLNYARRAPKHPRHTRTHHNVGALIIRTGKDLQLNMSDCIIFIVEYIPKPHSNY